MHRTTGRLADGREIIYYDEAAPRVPPADPRELPPAAAATDLRFDPLLREWVAITAHRQDRTHLPPPDLCPLCPSAPGRPTEIPAASYDVVVFENRFPSFGGGRGRCEVVCFTSDHHGSFGGLTARRAGTVMAAWADRTAELSRLPHVAEVFCFENRGPEIGVTLDHPHGQIYGYPFVTPRTRQLLDSARRHRAETGRCLFTEVLDAERRAGIRVIRSTGHWTAFVPEAARWPVEVHLYPHRRVPDLPALDEAERADFCDLYLDLLGRLDQLYDAPLPYVAAWHQAPARSDRDLSYLHLQLFSVRRSAGRLKYLAGSESGMGAFVNDVVPESVAARLRDLG
ncbi:galactose-1-phosphate uridylyltransferase [Actinomadura craniellae]|uniref:Galactose-1-phosphate uridylyltransferase n=1 Tax=Actinomadura craniellae TaxID=2231787 RepID=A0A365GVW3_9ACTN|nr:galactose-1-phosphate uridylyltransferase [Actinomadura craniellae]RAY10925.1 galactose-1-phosphate uridylyltransferase [Actinomadura craniellae]